MVEQQIQLLSQETIDKIAAGEVIERPASIIKELVENSIDANATAITVEIKDGGISLLRVSDNGSGILHDEIPRAFMRHCTSKIKSASDLSQLHSLGFRGEALSSIAAVASVELMTKAASEIIGTRYVIEGGKELSYEEVGLPGGTTFVVRQLFFNTPARKKFLKSASTEGSYIFDLIERFAISHPHIAFRLIVNGTEKLSTSGNGKQIDAIYQVYGREIAKKLLPIHVENEYFVLKGWIGEPSITRGNRGLESFFVQTRYIKSKLLSQAVEEGYRGFLMQHQYPFCALSFQFDGQDVDVNVHPTKQEVRFENETQIYQIIVSEIQKVLTHREDIAEVTLVKPDIKEQTKEQATEKTTSYEPFEKTRLEKFKKILQNEIQKDSPYQKRYEEYYEKNKEKKSLTLEKQKDSKLVNKTSVKVEQLSFLTEEAKKRHRYIGQLFQTYWMIEYDEKLYVIDQHAAHEKVLYERFLKELKDKEMISQKICPPLIVTLSPKEIDLLEQKTELFESIGFEFASFGGKEYVINAVPGNLYQLDCKELFFELLKESEHIEDAKLSSVVLDKVAQVSCKAAVKGNHFMSEAEANKLIEELLSLEQPYHCPHGRPTMISLSQYEVEKLFKRIVS